MQYRHQVITQSPYTVVYDGTDIADAMAAYSKAISDGVEYVTLESLRVNRPKEG